jgi:hypothetical protein
MLLYLYFHFYSCLALLFFYLDNFRLSTTFFIKFLQIFSFTLILAYIIIYNIDIASYANILSYAKDGDGVNLHGDVKLDKEAEKYIGQGLNSIGSQVGLGASIAGLGTAVAKGIAKSSMPPVQKAGIIVGSGLVTGLGHSVISNININRNRVINENISVTDTNTATINNTNVTANTLNSSINKFIDNTTPSSPLENLLFDIEALNYVCLSLIILLIIQILFKFYLTENITLNLSNILGINVNNKLEYYLNKIIKLNKKMSSIYV